MSVSSRALAPGLDLRPTSRAASGSPGPFTVVPACAVPPRFPRLLQVAASLFHLPCVRHEMASILLAARLLVLALLFAVVHAADRPVSPVVAPAPSATKAPAPFDPTSDRGRMLSRLGLPVPPPRAAPSNTTDESKALPAHSRLPDPLVLNNGQPVTTAAVWWQQRRAEIFEEFQRDIYGRIPANTPKVTWGITKTEDDGVVKTKTVVGKIDNSRFPALAPSIQLVVKTPSQAGGPVPLIVYASGGSFGGARRGGPPPPGGAGQGAEGASATRPPATAASTAASTAAGAVFPARGGAGFGPGAGGRGPAGPSLETLTLAKGWGYATFNTSSVQPDSAAGLTEGIIGLMNEGKMRARPDEWGVLMAWAWGLSKSVDYFETDRDVDAQQLAIDGFSRWGKTAVLAAALEPRWALAWAGNSGQSGTKINRRNFGETVDMVAQNFPWWMAGNFQKFFGNWEAMTVDSHELVALVAPRPVFITAGTTDLHCDPQGMFAAAALASPVYELLGRKGLGAKTMPEPDVALVSGELGFRLHTGGHTPAPDYATFLEFCGKYFAVRPSRG